MESSVTGGFTKKFDIPLGHLEFDYVKSCTDIKELEKILKVLRSNEEGHFPDLERCCEQRLTDLNPNSRVLRRDRPVGTKGDLDRNEREELDNDLKSWTDNMNYVDSKLNTPMLEEESELPPIRSGNITLTADGKVKETESTKANKRVMPRDYREWDKVDIDKELDKVDEQGDGKTKTVVGNREVRNIPDQVSTAGLSEQEKLMKANREKDKGNEAFRSGDYKEAISYYSRSISLLPTAASYNNRALAYLKHEDWQKAIADTNTVMKIEPQNIKALLRRGSAFKGLKQYDKAKTDLNTVLQLEPKNKKAQDMVDDIEKIIKKEAEERKTKGRRMVIEDVEGSDDEEDYDDTTTTRGTGLVNGTDKGATNRPESPVEKKPARRMQIEEVESEDDDDDYTEEIEVEKPPATLVNGHGSPTDVKSDSSSLSGLVNQEQSGMKENKSEKDVQSNSKSESADIEGEQNGDKGDSENELGEIVDKQTENIKVDNNETKQSESENLVKEDSVPVVTAETGDAEEGDVSKDSEAHVFKRPLFYKTEFPLDCTNLREEANTCFRNGQYGEGCQKYTKLINILEKAEDQIVNLSLTYSNRAACHLKTGDLPSAVRDCTKSLDLVPHGVKPLLRRAMAYEHLERYDKAYVDYRHVLLVDSNAQQAHLGTKRCQDYLSKKDGPRWREKVKLTQVSLWEIPEIRDIVETDTNSVHTQMSQKTRAENQQTSAGDMPQAEPVTKSVEEEKKVNLTPQQKFDQMKAQGNEFVKKGSFKEAVQCYTDCSEILPEEMVSYTNRALCYIRLNQAEKAECDCTKVLDVEKDNVKALFRRAQARKMLQNYSDGIKDLKHLLDLEPKNGPAKKEMEVLKNYWREQLQNLKKDMPAKSTSPDEGKTKSHPVKQDNKSRKRMVIEEVESDDETPPTMGKDSKGKKNGDTLPAQKSKSKIEEISSTKVKTEPVKSQSKHAASSETKSSKSTKTSSKKTSIKETSSGLPKVSKTVQKLEKVTPYEFMSAWNSLKKSETYEPYYDLLKQVKPSEIKTVLSNKLDGSMLTTIVKCVLEHFLKDGQTDTSYQLLENLSTVPRFSTVSMFMSSQDKADVIEVMEKLEDNKSSIYTVEDVKKLLKAYTYRHNIRPIH